MLGWLVRIVLAMAGVITGWFVARESPNYDIFQMAIGLLLVAFFVAVAAFWSSLADLFRNKRKPKGPKKF